MTLLNVIRQIDVAAPSSTTHAQHLLGLLLHLSPLPHSQQVTIGVEGRQGVQVQTLSRLTFDPVLEHVLEGDLADVHPWGFALGGPASRR